MKHKLLTLASAAALLAACSDTSVSDANDEIKETGTVTFFVHDALTKMPIKDVANYYRTDDKTKYTDSTGTIVWKNVDIGKSYFDFQKEGYAQKRHLVTVTDIIKHDVARVEDNTEKVPMYEIGVEVKGQFFYRDPETKDWKPAPNATLYIDYTDDEIYPNEVPTKTDSLGNYSFKNIAANVSFDVKSERFTVDSTVYEVAVIKNAESQRKGVVKLMDPMVAEVASLEPVLLSSNLSNVEVKGEIKLNFSEVLEKDSVKTKYFSVKRIGDPTKVDANNKPTDVTDVSVTVALSDDGKTVSIKSASGEWADGKDYLVEFDVWSKLAKNLKDEVEINGKKYKKFRLFTAGALAVPGAVKNLMVDLNDDDDKTEKVTFIYDGKYTYETEIDDKSDLSYNEVITLKWDAIEKGVDSYNVYAKGDIDAFADYIFVGNFSDTTAELNVGKVFNDNELLAFPASKRQPKVVTVIVLPVNSAGEALASGAKALEIKAFDKVKADIDDMQTTEYITQAKNNVKSTALYTKLYDCASEELSSCAPAVKTASAFAGVNYALDIQVDLTLNKDAADMTAPKGYDLYAETADGWTKCDAKFVGTTAVVEMDDKCSPFKAGARKYKASEGKAFEFVVMPYFEGAATAAVCSDNTLTTKEDCEAAGKSWIPATKGYKISQTSLNAKKGVYSTSEDLQDFIDEFKL